MNKLHHYSQELSQLLYSFMVVSALLFCTSFSAQAQDIERGEKLFKANCASCHKTSSQRFTGPGLAGVRNRVPSEEWLVKWVQNSPEVIKQGDPYALKIFEEYNNTLMPPQPLSEEEIWDVIAYVESEPHLADGDEVIPGEAPVKETDDTLYWLIAISVLFFVVIIVLRGVNTSLNTLLRERKGLAKPVERSVWEATTDWLISNKKFTALIVIVLLILGSVQAFEAMMGVGVYKGYAPEQPIKFSHEIHAGTNQIDCQYCHFGASKSKMAGIPSVNVCMNCHEGISSGSKTGETEIAKIYEAAGWNPEVMAYDKPPQPIKWIRVHNLPDLAYFNHSQHVVAGNIECTTCHGPVTQMEVLEQHTDLTMGWCINCHQETEVDVSNEYYQDMFKMHEEVKAKGIMEAGKFTVEHIGGLECAKCHY